MRTRNLLAVAAGLVCCIIVVWLSPPIHGGEKTYEIRPQVALPEYRSDAARAIDAYERLMDRYMGLTEMNLTRIGGGLTGVVKKLDSIDTKLTELSIRMARIERALGIEQTPYLPKNRQMGIQPKRPVEKKSPLEGIDKPIYRKFSPPPVE